MNMIKILFNNMKNYYFKYTLFKTILHNVYYYESIRNRN
jgi:hypothetical protein